MGATKRLPIMHSPAWMVLAGLLVRLLCIVVTQSYRLNAAHWSVFEMANLARSMATGHGFGSPFGGDTGPSAWTAPLYPWIIALAFRIFGLYSYGAAFALLALNSISAALTSWTIYGIARRVFNETVAVWSGWAWAIFPVSIYFAVMWIWETSLSAFLLSLLCLLTLKMENDNRLTSWIAYGLLWGIVGLTNTSMVAWLPFSGCWLAYQLHRRGKSFVVPVVVSAVVFWLTLAPWLNRNYAVFHRPVFIRADLGVELRSGNNSEAQGWWVKKYHPGNNGVLYAQYAKMGEVEFASEQGRLAEEWIAENPATFVGLCVRRFIYFWIDFPKQGVGVAQNAAFLLFSLLSWVGLVLTLKRRLHGGFLFATLVLFYPITYYVTFPTPRYRHAIDPELLILAVFAVVSLLGVMQRGKSSQLAGQHREASEVR